MIARRPGILGAAVAGLLLACGSAHAAAVTPGSPGCVPRPAPPTPGQLTIVSEKPLDARVTDLDLHSPAMQQDVHVNVMLPAGFDPSGATRYPVLYLLHGALGGYMDWYRDGDVEKLIGNTPMIVVMPDDGYDGSYSDWYGLISGASGPVPAWETVHTRELVPFIDYSLPDARRPRRPVHRRAVVGRRRHNQVRGGQPGSVRRRRGVLRRRRHRPAVAVITHPERGAVGGDGRSRRRPRRPLHVGEIRTRSGWSGRTTTPPTSRRT